MTPTRRLIETFLAEERALLATGLFGFALAGMLGVLILVNGPVIEPEARLFKAASFDFALGFFVITSGLLAPLAGFSSGGRAAWRRALVLLTLASYSIETGQMLRGLDPRFTSAGSGADQALGGIFFLVAQGLVVTFAILAWKFFRHASEPENELLVLAVRYGSLTTLLGFGVGYVMSATGGPGYGAAGNMLPLHAAGFHGLQAVPLVALLVTDSRLSEHAKIMRVHLAGGAWIVLCLGIAVQTAAGRPVVEVSVATAVALAALAFWVVLAARSAATGLPQLRHGAA